MIWEKDEEGQLGVADGESERERDRGRRPRKNNYRSDDIDVRVYTL